MKKSSISLALHVTKALPRICQIYSSGRLWLQARYVNRVLLGLLQPHWRDCRHYCHIRNGQRVLQYVYSLANLESRKRPIEDYIMRKSGKQSWSVGQHYMDLIMRRDEIKINHAEAIKLRKVRGTLSLLVQIHSSFLHRVPALVSYAGAFDLRYFIGFVD